MQEHSNQDNSKLGPKGCMILISGYIVVYSLGYGLYSLLEPPISRWHQNNEKTKHAEQQVQHAEQQVLKFLDDGTEQSFYFISLFTELPEDELIQTLRQLEQKGFITHNYKPLSERKYHIVLPRKYLINQRGFDK